MACFTIFVWGITFVCTKHLLNYFSALEILFVRFILAYCFLFALNPRLLKLSAKENFLVAVAGLTGVTLYQFTENLALDFTTASNVSIIVAICPIFTALTSQIFLKEKTFICKILYWIFTCLCRNYFGLLQWKNQFQFESQRRYFGIDFCNLLGILFIIFNDDKQKRPQHNFDYTKNLFLRNFVYDSIDDLGNFFRKS